jgi:shikimate dehydrogenase
MDKHTINAFVCGHPINHSRSPLIHNFWLNEYNINGSYNAIDKSTLDFPQFVKKLRDHNLNGGNITIPHKEIAYHLCDHKDDVSTLMGAVNTLWFEEGKLCATNTDAHGFSHNLDHHTPSWDTRKIALVLGAGGASRAIIYALIERGFTSIMLTNRTFEKALELQHRFRSNVIAHRMENVQELAEEAQIIINTTSLGMKGEGGFDLDMHKLNANTIVTDIVYTPLMTPLLTAAQQAGLKTVDGLGMLLHQAAPAFEKFFGVLPTVTPQLRQLLES